MNIQEIKRSWNKLKDHLAIVLLAVRATKVKPELYSKIKSGKYKQSLNLLLDMFHYGLAKMADAKRIFRGSSAANVDWMNRLLSGRVDDRELAKALRYKVLQDTARRAYKLQKALKSQPKKIPSRAWELAESLTFLYSHSTAFRQAWPRSLKPIIKELEDLLVLPAEDILAKLSPQLSKLALKYMPTLSVSQQIIESMKKSVKNVRVGKYRLDQLLDQEKALVLKIRPKDVAFKGNYVLFIHPKLAPSVFNDITEKKAIILAEKMAAVAEMVDRGLADLKREYRSLYGMPLAASWVAVKVNKIKEQQDEYKLVSAKSGRLFLRKVLQELKQAHGEAAKVKSKFQRGDKVLIENQDGELEEWTVTKVNRDGTLVLRKGRKKKTVNPLMEPVVLPPEARAEEELTARELKELEKLGITVGV